MTTVEHKHWFPPLCVLTDCWCLRLQSGVVVVGVITAMVASCAFAYHLCNFIMPPAIGEHPLFQYIHRQYNISMYHVYRKYWRACRGACVARNDSDKRPEMFRSLMRMFLKQFPDNTKERGMWWEVHKERLRDLEEPRIPNLEPFAADYLAVPVGFLSQYGEDAVERFMLDQINFKDPLSVAAGRAFWKSWKKTKAALRLEEGRKLAAKSYEAVEEKQKQIAMRILSGRRKPAHVRQNNPKLKLYQNRGRRIKRPRLPLHRAPPSSEIPTIGVRPFDIIIQSLPYGGAGTRPIEDGDDVDTNNTVGDGSTLSADPCWKDCIWPRVMVDIAMNNVRILLLNEVYANIHYVSCMIEAFGLIFAIIGMILGPILVCGAIWNNPWKILPWLVFGGFYVLWCCFYVDLQTGLIFYEIGYWNEYTTPSLIAGTAFVIILGLLAIFVVLSYFFLIFTVGYYLHHYPRNTQLVVSGGIE